VIGTLALEGYREAIDDVRYATTLRMEIDKANRKNSQQANQKADEALQWLENMDTRKVNLDEVRSEMIQRILELKKL
jgi:phage gp46-like protein